MTSKLIFKRDYLLLPILSLLYFLAIKNVIPAFIYLLIALLTSIYFFPIKLFLRYDSTPSNNKRRIVVLLSYFIISNIIALSALVAFQSDLGFIRTGISFYGLINFAFLIYFHRTEKGSYNFILACCTVVLTSAIIGV
ncbi:hypothetical protein [Gelidibacter sp.]|uniref:hypothetical protein n=1 Tax=Gelidibacter sp. TaxID=2018083 RepID=UPI003266C052